MQRSCNDRVHKFHTAKRHNRRVNSTETPGGSGIPAGWYDDPSGQGLRWWDGEQWTEHVHTVESAAAAAAGAPEGGGDREAPPRELVKLRESIRARGAKGVGMFLGAAVLVIVVVALLVSGGSESKGGNVEPGSASGKVAVSQTEIKQLKKQLKNAKLPKAEKKALEAELKKLEKSAGKNGNGGGKSSSNSKQNGGKAKKSSAEEGG
jgi:Protein of unknown function (DUF2510)